MILKVEWCIEKSMHAVSYDLVDHTTVRDHDFGNALEILVQRCDQLLGADAMRRYGETLDVSEQRSDLAPLTIELAQVRSFNDASDDRRGEMLFEPTAHERFPSARQRVDGAGRHREHQHSRNVVGQRIDEAVGEPRHGDRACKDMEKQKYDDYGRDQRRLVHRRLR